MASPAQELRHLDSLSRIIQSSKDDTTRLSALIAVSELIYLTDPDSNLRLCDAVHHEVKRLQARSRLHPQERTKLHQLGATALNNKAVSHFIFGELDSALILFRLAEVQYAAHGPTDLWAASLNNQGLIHGILGDHKEQRRCLFGALRIYQTAHDPINESKALMNLGNYYNERGLVDSAGTYLEKAVAIATTHAEKSTLAAALLNRGQFKADTGRPVEALADLQFAEDLFEAAGDSRGMVSCLNNIGSLFMDRSLHPEAIAVFHRALAISLPFGELTGQANLNLNIGSLFLRQGQLDLAQDHLKQAFDLYEQMGDVAGMAVAHANLGDTYKRGRDLAQAEHHLNEALQIARVTERPREIANALHKLARFLSDTGRQAEALTLHREGLELDRSIDDKEAIAHSLSSIAALLLDQGKTMEAARIGREALFLAEALDHPQVIAPAALVWHDVMKAQGNWREALVALDLHHRMKARMTDTEQAQQTLRIHLGLLHQRKQIADSLANEVRMQEIQFAREMAEVEHKQAQRRSWILGGGSLLLIAAGLILYRTDRKRRQERHQRRTTELELRLLRTQMNPHFLFNALHGLHSYILGHEPELASNYLRSYTRLMRLVLEHSRQEYVSLSEELEGLALYVVLEQARLKDKFTYGVQLQAGLDAASVLLPPLLLQPFVENSIWHGISPKKGLGHVQVHIKAANGLLYITIEDDGVGRSNTVAKDEQSGLFAKRSLATTITRERLELIGRRHGVAASLHVQDGPVGTSVEIVLPLIHDTGAT